MPELVINPADAAPLVQVEPAEPTPLMLIQRAIDRGVGMEHLKDLVDLARQLKADRAAEVWAEQVTKFQSLCLFVKKTRQTKGEGKFQFSYASLDDVMEVARPHLQECGLVVSFTSKPAAQGYEVTCFIRHGTHVGETTITLPCPPMSNISAVQEFGKITAYGKRYALCMALNIVISDEDDDAALSGEKIKPEEAQGIYDRLAALGKDVTAFVGWVKKFQPNVETVEDISAVNLPKVLDTIGRMKGKKS